MGRKKKVDVVREQLDGLVFSEFDRPYKRDSKEYDSRLKRRKEEAIDILKSSLGNVSLACEKVGIARKTFYQWRQNDPAFDEAVHEVNELTLDFVEHKLLDCIKKGNSRLIMYYLSCKGKSRGYAPLVRGAAATDDANTQPTVKIVISSDEAEY